ncbi:MAG: twin-arginine translocation signal domain-containing protein [Alphaproteobacteria bacterium]|nr:twin-arginine translocation signal domain-containing protein [Alphaproteobacteria bacterium]
MTDIGRRDFLQSAAAASALTTIGTLASEAAD